uniref:Agnoprotein n=1 Tax=Simian virus 40 TaxID=1891767 RepID=E3PQI8_SV40|nr:agnoprotein [Betapolyomavirus macacae]
MVLRRLSRQASVKVRRSWTETKKTALRIFVFVLELLLQFCEGEDTVDGRGKPQRLTENNTGKQVRLVFFVLFQVHGCCFNTVGGPNCYCV